MRSRRLTPVVLPLTLSALLSPLTGCLLGSGSAGADPGDDAAGLSPTPSAAPSVEAPAIPSAADLPGRVVSLDFADPDHGFALLARCRHLLAQTVGRGCSYHVAVLDGGGVWELRQAPLPHRDTNAFGFTVEAASPGHARLAATTGGALGNGGGAVWTTSDAGRSWQRAAKDPAGTTPAIPDGARLALTDQGLAALMPQTATYRTLDPQPALTELGPPGLLADGRHWVAGIDPATGEPALAVSRASKRGWRTLSPLPTAPRLARSVNHLDTSLVAGPAGRLYAFETGVPRQGTDAGPGSSQSYGGRLLGVYVSDDDGRSWRRVWEYRDGASRPGMVFGTPIAAADGSLAVYGYDAIYVSRDGGRSFGVERPGPPPEEPAVTRAGYLLTDLDHPGHYRVSADGFTWRTVVLGRDDG